MSSIRMVSQFRICLYRKHLPPSIRGGNLLTESVFRSAIIYPLNKEVIIHDGKITVQGWAYSGGGNWVQRVEVSPDGYATSDGLQLPMIDAYLEDISGIQYPRMTWRRRCASRNHYNMITDSYSKHFHAWRLWKIELPVDPEGWLEFCVRTWDSSNNTQPTFVRSAWK